MAMFDRKAGELPPLLYHVGEKIMGYDSNDGGQMLVGGEIIEAEQSKSHLSDNEYKVKLEPELYEMKGDGKEITWWIREKEAKPFKQDTWNRAVKHWLEHCKLKSKSYFEYLRMHRALRDEPDDIADEQIQKELDEKRKVNG